MKKYLIKIGNMAWFGATNVISACSFEAAMRHQNLFFYYILLGIGVWPVYLIPWYHRLKTAKNRSAGETPLQFYFRAIWGVNIIRRNH
jgi:hypothetical protein